MSDVAAHLSDPDFIEAVVQNDYLIDGHVLPTGARLREIAKRLGPGDSSIPRFVVCHEPQEGIAKVWPHLAWTVRGLPSGFCHGWFPNEGQARAVCDVKIARPA